MVLGYIFLGNTNHKHNFYNTYAYFIVTKFLEEIKTAFD